MKKKFSLLNVEPRHRIDLWKTSIANTFAPVEVVNYNPEGFEVQLETAPFGDLEVSRLSGVEQGISRPRRVIRPSDADIFVAMIQLNGSVGYEHGGREASGLVNSVTLFDMTREYGTMMKNDLDIIDVTIPRKLVETLFGSTRNLAGLSLGPDDPTTLLVTEFFRCQLEIADQLTEESAQRLGRVGADLLAAAFLEKIGKTPDQTVTATAITVRAKVFIRNNLGDPTLAPDTVAINQKLSLRRMQELFAAESLTIGDYIWEQRLLRAKSMLESMVMARLQIADIAYSCGFVSLPHFARRFRIRFGCTPSEARQAALFNPAIEAS